MKRFSSNSQFIIAIACLVTTLFCILFGGLVDFEKLKELQPNALGDTLAGISASIAFIWVIASIFIQAQEISMQSKEISELSDSSEAQAKALIRSAQTQSILLLDRKQDEAAPWIANRLEIIAQSIMEIVRDHTEVVEPIDFLAAPRSGLKHILGGLLKEEPANSISDFIERCDLVDGLNYDLFLRVSSVVYQAREIWKVNKPLWEIAHSTEIESHQHSFEATQGINWLWVQYPLYEQLEKKISQSVISGQISAPPMQIQIHSATQEGLEEFRTVKEPAWQFGNTAKLEAKLA